MSLRQAINDKCKDCIYDPESGLGTWRQQVDACGAISCPLHPVRPRSSSPKLFYQLAEEIEGDEK
jgi:hypothetical protein